MPNQDSPIAYSLARANLRMPLTMLAELPAKLESYRQALQVAKKQSQVYDRYHTPASNCLSNVRHLLGTIGNLDNPDAATLASEASAVCTQVQFTLQSIDYLMQIDDDFRNQARMDACLDALRSATGAVDQLLARARQQELLIGDIRK